MSSLRRHINQLHPKPEDSGVKQETQATNFHHIDEFEATSKEETNSEHDPLDTNNIAQEREDVPEDAVSNFIIKVENMQGDLPALLTPSIPNVVDCIAEEEPVHHLIMGPDEELDDDRESLKAEVNKIFTNASLNSDQLNDSLTFLDNLLEKIDLSKFVYQDS